MSIHSIKWHEDKAHLSRANCRHIRREKSLYTNDCRGLLAKLSPLCDTHLPRDERSVESIACWNKSEITQGSWEWRARCAPKGGFFLQYVQKYRRAGIVGTASRPFERIVSWKKEVVKVFFTKRYLYKRSLVQWVLKFSNCWIWL